MSDRYNTVAAALGKDDVIIERSDTGGVLHRITVNKFASGPNACARTKVHVNDSLCYDSSQPLEILPLKAMHELSWEVAPA